MGAMQFETEAHGKNAREAFGRAVRDAQYESGHGGYTGTIAEKHSAVMVAVPPRWTARKLEAALCAHSAVRDAQRYGVADFGKRDKYEREDIRRSKALVEAFGSYEADRLSGLYDDKWGPALGVELRGSERTDALRYLGTVKRGEKVYRFFGMASS